MPFQIIRNDITKVTADVIVNTANPEPKFMAGTDAAVYRAAGEEKLLAERKKIGNIAPGDVAVTPAFNLPAKYIIHTVGPTWVDGKHHEFDILRSCYRKSLVKAAELGAESIAFPLIATGIYGFPKADALEIAIKEISSFLMKEDTEMTIMLVVFDERAFMLSKNVFFQIESFIDDEEVKAAHLKEYSSDLASRYERQRSRYNQLEYEHILHHLESMQAQAQRTQKPGTSAFQKEQYMKDPSEDLSFQKHLMGLLKEKGIDNATVYKLSNITKGAFSKILCGDTKIPKKTTALALCIGLRLELREAEELLASAGLAFNPYSKADQLVIKCILDGNYDIYRINIMLEMCGQPQLGNVENRGF